MKITKDDKGKHIIDFEGLKVKADINCFFPELFNPETVSAIKNGWFGFINGEMDILKGSWSISPKQRDVCGELWALYHIAKDSYDCPLAFNVLMQIIKEKPK